MKVHPQASIFFGINIGILEFGIQIVDSALLRPGVSDRVARADGIDPSKRSPLHCATDCNSGQGSLQLC